MYVPVSLYVCVRECVCVLCVFACVCLCVCRCVCASVCVVWTLVYLSQVGFPIPFTIQNRKGQLGNVLNWCWEDRAALWSLFQMGFVLNLQVRPNPITAKFIDCDAMWIETKKGLYRVLSVRFYSWLQEAPHPGVFFSPCPSLSFSPLSFLPLFLLLLCFMSQD